MPGLLEDRTRTPRSSGQESSRGCNILYIPPDDSIPISFMHFYDLSKGQTKVAVAHISVDSELKSSRSERAKRQMQNSSAGSTRRAPLQQNSKVVQARATTVDVPGTGGGKENVPPGSSIITNNKTKSEYHLTVSSMARPVLRNTTLRECIATKTKEGRTAPLERGGSSESRDGQHPQKAVFEKVEPSSPAVIPSTPALKRAFAAIVIQRAWRSLTERRNMHECGITTARVRFACTVITRWWRGVKACKLRGQKQQAELAVSTEQITRRKPASQRRSVCQGHQSSARRGIRRL
ncbi:hypothetical protein N7535_001396 [Penicillium sp. DV-2018c]|nr:hypothetical protein N7461_005356 [Penicillium sp. DV-2018c]KAJ5582776.1 hypothetical protein N7535_001396 [Penicillium sp. DV-2018c]